MRNAQRRLEQLESQIQGVWPAEVEAAKSASAGPGTAQDRRGA